MRYEHCFAQTSDDDLLRRLTALVEDSRRVEAELVAHIGEVDDRRLYAREASPSMYAYGTEVLHLSEAEAYLRIAAARAARQHPLILDMLGDGRLHLSGIGKLAPHLTTVNAADVLARAAYRSKRQIEELVAEIAPRPDAPTSVRKLPTRTAPALREDRAQEAGGRLPDLQLRPDGVGSTDTSSFVNQVEPLAPDRYKIQFTASSELRDKLERLQKLLGARGPSGDLASVIEHLVTEKLERLERSRFALTKAPRRALQHAGVAAAARYVPAAVRRAVYARDGGRCRYTDEKGRRCSERHRLEYHHRHPYGLGGDHSLANVCLMCRAHNQYLGERDYGTAAMLRYRSGSMTRSSA